MMRPVSSLMHPAAQPESLHGCLRSACLIGTTLTSLPALGRTSGTSRASAGAATCAPVSSPLCRSVITARRLAQARRRTR